MNRHRAYWPLDDAPVADGDLAFTGVNALLDPALLVPGEVAMAVNARFDEGRAATRKGIRIMPWGAQGYQAVDPAVVQPYGTTLLAEAFADPYGTEWLVIVTTNGSYKTQPGAMGTPIPLPPGEAVSSATDLIQAYNGLVMLRGANANPLYMRDVDEGWLTLPVPPAGFEAIPPSTQGIYFQNRLMVIDARSASQYIDTVWVSDIGGVSSTLQGEVAYNSFKINTGSSDRLVAIAKYDETTVVCAKERSIYVIRNLYGTNEDMATNAVLALVTSQYGCLAPRTFVQVGKDLWFLGHKRGVCSLRRTEDNSLQGVDVPVSREIQPLIDRINWEWATSARAEVHDNRVYFAVPLDTAQSNNAVLVYSLLTNKWCGYDYSAATVVQDFVKFTYAGVVRLGFLSTDGFVCLYEDGYYDQTGDAGGVITNNPIVTTIRTRGYTGKSAGNKRFFRASARVASWDGQYTVTALPNGYNESASIASVTKDNTRYYRPHGATAWEDDNSNGDWDTPWRQDYAVDPDGLQATALSGGGTVAFDVLQETEETWSVPRHESGHTQIEFASARGRLEVIGLRTDTRRGTTANTVTA